jgi:hypothetical protein
MVGAMAGNGRGVDANMVRRLMAITNERVEQHEYEQEDHRKVTISDVHRNLMDRVDDRREVHLLAATKRALPRQTWRVFVALELGWVEDERGIFRPHPATQEPKKRYPTVEEVAAYYHLSDETVERYGQQGRKTYNEMREQVADLEDWEL